MKRRRFIQTLAAAPVAPALLAQQAAPVEAPAPELVFSIPEDASEPVLRFFSRRQFATLQRLSDVLMAGASEALVPEFMDFLVGAAPVERQQLWREGLDALESQSQTRFAKPFSGIDAAQVETLMAPLRQPWTYDPPADPVARLLAAAKLDIRTATINSPLRNPVPSAGPRRRGGGGLYWLPVE